MGKKAATGSKHKAKKGPVQKAKKSRQFKALTKHETRQVVVQTERRAGAIVQQKVVSKKSAHRVPEEFRNFDERMAAARMKKQAARAAPAPSNPIVAAPSFVMPAATFQFNTAPAQEAPREVEGFHGFLAAMQAPATAPVPSAPRESRKQKIEAPANPFAVLDDEPEPIPQNAEPPAMAMPSFMQPATFTFQTNATSGAPTMPSTGLTSLQRSLMGSTPSPFAPRTTTTTIDPDL